MKPSSPSGTVAWATAEPAVHQRGAEIGRPRAAAHYPWAAVRRLRCGGSPHTRDGGGLHASLRDSFSG